MAATKQKLKGRKGLLPPVVASPPKGKPGKQSSQSSVPAGKKGVAAPVTPSKHPTSSAEQPSKAAKVDKYTGKKKGTLFSAAPSPCKASDAFFRQKTSAMHSPHHQAQHADAQFAVAKMKPGKKRGSVKNSRRNREGKGSAAALDPGAAVSGDVGASASAIAAVATAPSSNKGATGKINWDRLKVHALEQSETAPAKPGHHHSHTYHPKNRKRKQAAAEHAQHAATTSEWVAAASEGTIDDKLVPKSDDSAMTEVLALDCEMVGVGTNQGRKRDALARATLVCPAFCPRFSMFQPFAS